MRAMFAGLAAWLSLGLSGPVVLGETAKAVDAEMLLKLAPRISLEEAGIESFEVQGILDFGGVRLRLIVSGRKPDRLAIRILDPRDGTPVLVAVGDRFMLYDPVAAEVVTGQAVSRFVAKVEKDPENASPANPDPHKVTIGLVFHSKDDAEKEPATSVIDVRSFLASLVKPLEVSSEDGRHLVVTGVSRRGSRVKAFVTPSRKQGPYTRVELYQAGFDQPFLVLDEIVLNRPLPAARFEFPQQKLAACALPTRELSGEGPVNTVLSVGRLVRAMMTRLVLAGVDDAKIRSTVEVMSGRKLDWEKLREDDKKAAKTLKSIFPVTQSTEKRQPIFRPRKPVGKY